ncbi:PKD-like family lipoprotein [Sphingobacterium tabacisoli]|uniref:PKD-like family lipoprotein n=1 Tax=Sphingobacterium tabacisoli TaxID=2044855 RepID=A0ABW5KX22_9SPHI|nr:PKD-like family lipoprotein [Sphingobacterium tabacisoli]
MIAIHNKFWGIFMGALLLSSCYKDLGTGPEDYQEINEIKIDGIERQYALDMDDSLKISPKLEGTLYSDTSRFNYLWEIDSKKVGQSAELATVIKLLPGNKVSRFIVEDKETKVKSYFRFEVNVSSSTAGDLIMVLSKSNGKAEISYLRLDKPSNWVVNYYESRFGKPLGTNPQRLNFLMLEATLPVEETNNAPFANRNGRVLVLVDNQLALIDKGTLEPNVVPYLEADAFTRTAYYPKPDTEGYKPEFMASAIYTWRKNPYGSGIQQMENFQLISGGALYYGSLSSYNWTPSFAYNGKSAYGRSNYFSPFGYYHTMTPTVDKGTMFNHSYDLGDFIVFDRTVGRFSYSNSGISRQIPTTDVKAFPGYDLIYGSPTSQSGTSYAVLKSSSSSLRFLLLGKAGTKYSLTGEVSGGVATEESKFYNMKTSPYVVFTAGNKLYKYNVLDIGSGTVPGTGHEVLSLSSLGYDNEAKITSMSVSRSEGTLLLGVSRYGADNEGSGTELKGDVLRFDLDRTTLRLNLKEKYEGISGIPVDVKVKYQTNFRDGRSDGGVTLIDNI